MKVKTNLDKLHNMTDDQLAKFLSELTERPCMICRAEEDCSDITCEEGFLEWLRRECDNSERSKG